MSIYYSPSTRGFYTIELHGSNIPKDSKEITEARHQELLDGQMLGKNITIDKRGKPVLTDPVGPTPAEVTAKANEVIIAQIQEIESTQQPRAMRDMLINNDNTRLLAIEAQISELRAQLK